jgi:hypothetical protein
MKPRSRCRKLETLDKIAEKVDKLTVFGGLEGVLKDTVDPAAGGIASKGRDK